MIRVCRKHTAPEFLRVADMGEKRSTSDTDACSGLCLNRDL